MEIIYIYLRYLLQYDIDLFASRNVQYKIIEVFVKIL